MYDRYYSLDIWKNSLLKPCESRVFFVEKSLNTNTVSLINTGFSISCGVHFNVVFLVNFSIYLNFQVYWQTLLQNTLIFVTSVQTIVMVLILLLLLMCFLSFFLLNRVNQFYQYF